VPFLGLAHGQRGIDALIADGPKGYGGQFVKTGGEEKKEKKQPKPSRGVWESARGKKSLARGIRKPREGPKGQDKGEENTEKHNPKFEIERKREIGNQAVG
jgi:hypothetical protein